MELSGLCETHYAGQVPRIKSIHRVRHRGQSRMRYRLPLSSSLLIRCQKFVYETHGFGPLKVVRPAMLSIHLSDKL